MIIKIVHCETTGVQGVRVADGELDMPTRVVLIDGVDEVQHERVAPLDGQELSDLAMKFGAFDGSWYGPAMKEGQKPPMEAILMRLVRDHKFEYIVAVAAQVFFMNENGKTIDKVVCR